VRMRLAGTEHRAKLRLFADGEAIQQIASMVQVLVTPRERAFADGSGDPEARPPHGRLRRMSLRLPMRSHFVGAAD